MDQLVSKQMIIIAVYPSLKPWIAFHWYPYLHQPKTRELKQLLLEEEELCFFLKFASKVVQHPHPVSSAL